MEELTQNHSVKLSEQIQTFMNSFIFINPLIPSFQVGYDTCDHSDDRILQQDMPPALQRVEGSSKLLEESSLSLKVRV